MDIRSTLITGPEAEPLTLAEVKLDRVVTHDQHNSLFEHYIQAARELAEQATGRALMPQVWQQLVPAGQYEVPLEKWPALEIVSLSINGAEVDHAALIAAGELEFYPGDNPLIVSRRFCGARVVLQYRAGYASASAVPASIKKWMLLHIGSMYEHRESEVSGTITTKLKYAGSLINHYRIR